MKSSRRDITNSLIHLTGDREAEGGMSAEDALIAIIQDKTIKASNASGYIRGGYNATCLTEMPLSSLKLFIDEHTGAKKYSYYGIAMSRQAGWVGGARPVIYLPKEEANWIPEDQVWRHVTLDHDKVDWTHEREWRCKGDLSITDYSVYAIVPNREAEERIRFRLGGSMSWIIGFLHMEYINDIL